ncbi:helix-turn-helix domain-containing protein [Cystobacter fuscus]
MQLTAGQRRLLVEVVRRGGRQGVALRAAALLLSAQGQSVSQVGKDLGVTLRAEHGRRCRWRSSSASP